MVCKQNHSSIQRLVHRSSPISSGGNVVGGGLTCVGAYTTASVALCEKRPHSMDCIHEQERGSLVWR
jgi:hypothetical protein